MLVLTRKTGEKISLGDNVVVTVVQVKGNRVRLGIEAPSDTHILRAELPKFLDVELPEPPAADMAAC